MQVQARWSNPLEVENHCDENGNPTGGSVHGIGLSIAWQDGPLGRGDERKEPNGAFAEDVLLAVITRLKHYQNGPAGEQNQGKFACRENVLAITHMEEALYWLQARHDEREARQVQGLHQK